MLQTLHIQNYALIDSLELQLHPGFSVITGETGAGKSILLGAIGLLLGARADSKAIKQGAQKCVIEATFGMKGYGLEPFFEAHDIDYEEACIIRREISQNGKSRAFVNDTPTPVATLRELGDMLIDIHSQHQNLLLNKEDFQLEVVDILAHNNELLQTYGAHYHRYLQCVERLEQARQQAQADKDEEDYISYQLAQLDEARLKPHEQEELQEKADMLQHAEEIKQALCRTDELLYNDNGGAVHLLREAGQLLSHAARLYAPVQEAADRMDSCHIELKDLADQVTTLADRVDFDPNRLDAVNERLDLIYNLLQRHRVESVEELLALQEELRTRLDHIGHSEEHLAQLEQERREALESVMELAATLSGRRKTAAADIEQQMRQMLVPLGIPNVRLEVRLETKDHPDAKGTDKVSFLFSANKNAPLQPVSEVASGGEIARVMLSIKAMISGAVQLPTIIFDEIDTGVSGRIAEKMAHIMQQMGAPGRQVISITHLPQIAAAGSSHYKVYKEDGPEGTTSHIIVLDDTQRVEEIAHMLSGSKISEAAMENARELLMTAHDLHTPNT